MATNNYDKTGGNKNEDDIDIEFVNDNKGINLNKDNNENKKNATDFLRNDNYDII